MNKVKDVVVEKLAEGDVVYTGPTRDQHGEWQKVRSVQPLRDNEQIYGVKFGGLTMERPLGTKMAVRIT